MPRRAAVRWVQTGEPKGRPWAMDWRTASSLAGVWGSLTQASQSRGRATPDTLGSPAANGSLCDPREAAGVSRVRRTLYQPAGPLTGGDRFRARPRPGPGRPGAQRISIHLWLVWVTCNAGQP